MPLEQGSSQEVISHNIEELRAAGHPEAQAVAIAEREAKDAGDIHAAGIVYVADGRVLLLKRTADAGTHPLTWGLPAGGTEPGETPAQTASRESVEEVAHAPASLVPLGERDGFALFLSLDARFAPVLNEEHDGWVWAKPDDLPTPLHPGVADEVAIAVAAAARPMEQEPPPATDTAAMDESARILDTNGWFEVRGNPLSKVGVFMYRGRQVGDQANPDKEYWVYRPAEELSSPECIESFRLLPWIDGHVMLGDPERGRTPAEHKGVQGVIGEEVFFDPDTDDGVLRGNIKVFSQSLANAIEAGKRELSCGYACKYERTPGEFKGQRYDLIQRRIRGNHLALVDTGRMGPDVAVLDSIDSTTDAKEPSMADKESGGGSGMTLEQALEKIKEVMPAIAMIQTAYEASCAMLNGTTPVIVTGDADPDKKEGASGEGDMKKPEDGKSGKDAAEPDKKEGNKDEPKKEGEAMDAAATFKQVMGQVARRDRLAGELSKLVGTFDHAEMTEAEVAAYGVQKLGLKAESGAEAATLAGYLAGKAAAPKAETTPATAAMDSASRRDNFVTRHLNKGE